MVNDNFHPFPRLPLELREEIWRLCLPHGMYEMDEPNSRIVWEDLGLVEIDAEDDKYPCWFYWNSKSNIRPPLLTRICRESRSVAWRTGEWIPLLEWHDDAWSFEDPCEADWKTGKVIDRGHWEVTSRDTVHLNWTPAYDIDFGPRMQGHPLTSLAREAKRLKGTASFMLQCIITTWFGEREPYDKSISYPLDGIPISQEEQENLAALELLPEWLVVVRVVVIHLDIGRAADSGLFGLLGDEIIQVVDATLPLAKQLYALAEHCEHGAPAVTCVQDFTRMSTDDMDAMVKRVAYKVFHEHEVGKRLRPAIMFRLCTEMCNHINTPGEEQIV